MAEQNPWKTKNQLKRAHKLVEVIDNLPGDHDNATRLAFAEALTTGQWADVALLAAILPPSTETVAMVCGILEARRTNEQMEDAFAGFPAEVLR